MALAHSPKVVTNNIRIFLDAGNLKSYQGSGTTWSDMSGNGNNFTNTNVTYNAAGYFTYDGSTSESLGGTPNNFSFDSNSYTVCVWFRAHTATPAANMAVFTDNFGPEVGVWVLTSGNTGVYGVGGISAGSTTANQWCYACFTGSSGAPNSTDTYVLNGYFNGEFISTATGTVGNGMNDWPLTLGYDRQSGVPTNYFDGDIAIVQVYQTILTASEIKQNYNAHRKRFGL